MAAHTIPSGSKSVVYGPGNNPSATLVNNSIIVTNPSQPPGGYRGDDALTIYQESGITLVNTGSIIASYLGSSGNPGVGVEFNGIAGQIVTITNTASGVIKETAGYGVGVEMTGGTLFNAGYISGASANGYAGVGVRVGKYADGLITNTGTIAGGGIYAKSLTTIVNSGKILGLTGNYSYGDIGLGAGGTITNLATGTILAENGTYGVSIGAAGTVINAGYISNGSGGGDAVTLSAGFTNLVVVDPGARFHGKVDGGGTISSTLELGSGASVGTMTSFGSEYINFGTLTFAPSAQWLFEVSTANIPGVIDGFVQGDTIDITGFTATSISTIASNTKVVLTNSGGTHETISFGGTIGNFEFTSGSFGTELTTICFCVGTLIDTPNGEVQVENLHPGDIVSTAHNGPRKVTWVGQGKVLATRGRRSAATPVIVRKGALAPKVPHEDLRVTKAHALYIDDVLIPVEFLVNHKTILWDDHAKEVEIYHVELESHDVLIANGAPAESYRDDGNRWLFQNANSGWDLPPQEPYAPVLTGGPVVDAVWQRLLDRAGPRDLPPLTDDPDLHLIVDGVRVDAQERRGSTHVFRLPSQPASVLIASRAAAPAEFGFARDPRPLGVALRRVAIRQGGKFALLDADDERLTSGFHDYEPAERLRWTDGYAELPIEAFARFDRGAEVMLHLGGTTQYPDNRDRVAA